ncbi:hypothetical protein [Rhizobium sp. WYJ-E13]|uniref:hypothetical protein n=1 Tax=Rhizobium sp. WYJ-E13 TaxID=2849093 RepID=UPI001C1E8EDB|nr:hypothetical protein [Rhizobium sp. WYJ-E13]QWW68257.1 hypothetical protein KQ933_00680 [Rhizobium sp. WYJ-E13]
MTIAVVWLEDDGLWCVSDTRISRRGQGGGVQIVTDAGAKIYPLNVECRLLTVERELYYGRRYGMVFAGMTAVATQTFATLSGMCQALQGASRQDIPSLRDVATLLSKLVELYVRDFRASTTLADPGVIEILLFGMCPVSRSYEIWRVSDQIVEGSLHVAIDQQPARTGDVVAIGSQVSRFQEILAELKQKTENTFRLPKIAVGQMADASRGDVGGAVSIGICNQFGFQTYWSLGLTPHGQGARLMFGVDLDDIGWVGPVVISGGGMA